MIEPKAVFAALWLSILGHTLAFSQLAGQPSNNPLVIVNSGQSTAMILIDPSASETERAAAADLHNTIEKMTGAKVRVLSEILRTSSQTDARVLVGDLPSLGLDACDRATHQTLGSLSGKKLQAFCSEDAVCAFAVRSHGSLHGHGSRCKHPSRLSICCRAWETGLGDPRATDPNESDIHDLQEDRGVRVRVVAG